MKNSMQISSRIKNYSVYFEQDYSFLENYKKDENNYFLIDSLVYDKYSCWKDIPKNKVFVFEAIETNKTLEYAGRMIEEISSLSTKKKTHLIAVGGGITQDMVGFVASILYRGISWTLIPTTLLSQTDSCIGSKTSINHSSFKNIIGTYYPPNSVHIFHDFLHTLTKDAISSGLGECLKLILMNSQNIPWTKDNLEKKIPSYNVHTLDKLIQECLLVKKPYIEEDEFDQGIRNLLNYGHCYGHAVETSSSYAIPHGVAVIMGMIFANYLGEIRLGLEMEIIDWINKKFLARFIDSHFCQKEYFDETIILKSLYNDKKREGKHLTVIIPDKTGRLLKISDCTEAEFLLAHQKTWNLIGSNLK